MALTPLLGLAGRRFADWMRARRPVDPALLVRPEQAKQHAIVVGYGRVGKVVCALLREHGVPYIAADLDALAVTRDRRGGQEVFYGDAADTKFLEACGLANAAGVVITIHDHKLIDEVVENVRTMRSDILIVARARDAEHARHLYALGATDAVPETIEASLQLSEAALVGLGIAAGPAIASIHEKRDEIRHTLQKAALEAGRNTTRAVKPKTGNTRATAAP
jgi:CPA2 family monovalent cation:H+ antiporter-2